MIQMMALAATPPMSHENGLFNSAFPVVFVVIIAAAAIGILFIASSIFEKYSQLNDARKQPVLIVAAKIVGKRTYVSSTSHNELDPGHSHASTNYYVTFEVETGSRMELGVSGHEYGMLAERDSGKLKFQGTRYLGFERAAGSRRCPRARQRKTLQGRC